MKTIILCAGKGDRYNRRYPKSLESINGEMNYKRTINLLLKNNIEDVLVSTSKENTKFFDYSNKIVGSNKREIDRFRNLRDVINGEALILYGDVVYHPDDIKLILNSLNKDILPFGRKEGNTLTGKVYGEIMGVFIRDYKRFFKAVDDTAIYFEKGIIPRELTWEVMKVAKIEDFIELSLYSDDYDTVEEYEIIKNIYA